VTLRLSLSSQALLFAESLFFVVTEGRKKKKKEEKEKSKTPQPDADGGN
jgi:hypothetical protein